MMSVLLGELEAPLRRHELMREAERERLAAEARQRRPTWRLRLAAALHSLAARVDAPSHTSHCADPAGASRASNLRRSVS
jgi:hypothetical protein